MASSLNENQLKLLTNYVSGVVQNNQEVHPSDMPPVIAMFKLLSDRNYVVSDEQIDTICESLHSLSNHTIKTSEILKDFLKNMATTFGYLHHPHHPRDVQMFKRSISSIADDIISERDVEYSEIS